MPRLADTVLSISPEDLNTPASISRFDKRKKPQIVSLGNVLAANRREAIPELGLEPIIGPLEPYLTFGI
jgi:hypothetical protein